MGYYICNQKNQLIFCRRADFFNFGIIQKFLSDSGTLKEAVAVSTFGNCGVAFMSAYADTAQRAVILRNHVVLALLDRTFDAVVFVLVFHNFFLLQKKYLSAVANDIINANSHNIHEYFLFSVK